MILFEWIKLVELKGGSVPGYLMKEKAKEIWNRTDHDEREEARFSDGWLEGF